MTDNENVANINEIPTTWGWIHVSPDGKLKVLKEAPKLSPIQITRSFLACLLKRAACKDGYVTIQSIQDKVNESRESGLKEGERNGHRLKERYDQLAIDVKEFEEVTGLQLN